MTRQNERTGLPENLSVILHRPAIPENIGAVARVLANTGFHSLFISCPETDDWATARKLAVSAAELLERAPILSSLQEALSRSEARYIIGTTGRERKYWDSSDIDRSASEIVRKAADSRVAIVFGPESSGLSNEELTLCHKTITIPTAGPLQSYNLSHAVAIVLFQMMVADLPGDIKPAQDIADFDATEGMFGHIEEVLAEVGFLWKDNPDHMMRLVRSFINRARPNTAEATALRGICRRLLNYLRYGEQE